MSADLTGQRLGHYLVQEVIGRGGMSVVYRGLDDRLQRSVALKVMSDELSSDPEFRTRFLEEARAASAIDHVNVVPLYDFGETDGALFIAMRLVDGTDLARELAGGPLPVRRALALLGQVGAALDMLHERGMVHLDVKPANVLITRNESVGTEHVYLADFGLTRRGAGGHRTAAGDFLGSPSYASPEHLRGGDIGPGSDEYSMTCLLFAALSGRPPYVGDVRTVVTGHLSGLAPSLSALADVPPALDRVIARGLAADPALRYATTSDLLTAVRRAIADGDDAPSAAVVARPSAAFLPVAAPSSPAPSFPAAPFSAGTPVLAGTAAPRSVPSPYPPRPQSGAPGSSPMRFAPAPGPGIAPVPGSSPVPRPAPGAQQPAPVGQQPGRSPQFPGGAAHRPAGHRTPAARSRWPWLVGLVLVAVVAVVLVVVATRSSAAESLRPAGSGIPVAGLAWLPGPAASR